jgi:hypothetical protein
VIASETHLSLRRRVSTAVWVGWLGGLVFGLSEAWIILARNAAGSGSALPGLLAAMGFVVALDGAVGAIALAVLGAVAARIDWMRRRFAAPPAWAALCAAVFAGLLMTLLAMLQLGVLNGSVTGLRAVALSGVGLAVAAIVAAIVYAAARATLASARENVARIARRAIVAVWFAAALLPLAFALIRSRLA